MGRAYLRFQNRFKNKIPEDSSKCLDNCVMRMQEREKPKSDDERRELAQLRFWQKRWYNPQRKVDVHADSKYSTLEFSP